MKAQRLWLLTLLLSACGTPGTEAGPEKSALASVCEEGSPRLTAAASVCELDADCTLVDNPFAEPGLHAACCRVSVATSEAESYKQAVTAYLEAGCARPEAYSCNDCLPASRCREGRCVVD